MIEFKDTKMTKQQYDIKVTCVQACSNEEMDATNGFIEFFQPKNIYNMHMFMYEKCTQMQ